MNDKTKPSATISSVVSPVKTTLPSAAPLATPQNQGPRPNFSSGVPPRPNALPGSWRAGGPPAAQSFGQRAPLSVGGVSGYPRIPPAATGGPPNVPSNFASMRPPARMPTPQMARPQVAAAAPAYSQKPANSWGAPPPVTQYNNGDWGTKQFAPPQSGFSSGGAGGSNSWDSGSQYDYTSGGTQWNATTPKVVAQPALANSVMGYPQQQQQQATSGVDESLYYQNGYFWNGTEWIPDPRYS